ncbi:hypothetical protein ACHWQZ_G005245 [Mnemiopsis leidyi]
MSIQTRSKKRNYHDRNGRFAKLKQESMFFAGALQRIKKSKMKKSKGNEISTKLQEDCNENNVLSVSGPSGISYLCSKETDSGGRRVGDIAAPGADMSVRSNLFEKFKIPKLNLTENLEKFSTFEYISDDNRVKSVKSSTNVKGNKSKHDVSRQCYQQEISNFASEILLNVKQKIDNIVFKDKNCLNTYQHKPTGRDFTNKNIFADLPDFSIRDNSLKGVKDFASQYLNSFLEAACETDCLTNNVGNGLPGQNSRPKRLDDVQLHSESCYFGETLFDEGYLSKPLSVQSACPWPTSDRCLLSSRVENKNGQIYVVKEQKRQKNKSREILADIKKKKRSLMLGAPPKFITPMEYHTRILEHREYLERRQWQNIVNSQDYDNLYHDKKHAKIPEYIYHNQTRHGQTANSQLLGYLDCRSSLFSDETWERIETMAVSSTSPLPNLSPFHIDHFFYQFFFFSTAYLKGMRRPKKRRRSNLYNYFQPELYILPQHRIAKQQNALLKYYPFSQAEKCTKISEDLEECAASSEGCEPHIVEQYPDFASVGDNRDVIPSLPKVPRASTNSPSKSPELRTVENVYCYKRKSSSLF